MGYRELNTFVKLPDDVSTEWFAVFRVSWDAEPEIVGYVAINPLDGEQVEHKRGEEVG